MFVYIKTVNFNFQLSFRWENIISVKIKIKPSLNFKCVTLQGRRGRDRMVVGFTTPYGISAYHHWWCVFEPRSGRGVQHYVLKFVTDLR